jgi:hypothetical protein
VSLGFLSLSSPTASASPGYKLTNQRSDFLARFAVQVIFLCRGRFYDYEKPVGHEQGRAVYASDYGFTSDRVSELDAASRHGGAWGPGTFGLTELMSNGVFVLRSNGNKSSVLPALADTPDSVQPIDSDHKPPEDNEHRIGSERRHHLQLSTLNRPSDPLAFSPQREKIFKIFQEESSASESLPPATQTPPAPTASPSRSTPVTSPNGALPDRCAQ